MTLFDNPYFQKLLDLLRKQAEAGVPIESQGFVTHYEDTTMPDIRHDKRRKRPDWVETELDGWEPLQ